MRQVSPAAQQAIARIAERHGFSDEATFAMLDAVIRGNGGMAQFSHPEFSGSGQWMRGGMIMVSDMFNNGLKTRIDRLCLDLAGLADSQPDLVPGGSFQSQDQGSHGQAWRASGDWWPDGIGRPNSTGAQNNMRYAYFRQARRLAVDVDGEVCVYDTLDHDIGGFSQQQSHGGSITLTSQHGPVNLSDLPLVSRTG